MEFVEAFLDEEWESLSKMFSVGGNNPDFSLFPSSDSTCDHENKDNESSFFLPSCNDHHTTLHTNFYNCFSQESSNSINNNGVNFYHHHHHHHHEDLTNNTFDECMNYYATMTVPVFADDVIMEEMFNNEQSGGGNNAEADNCCKEVIQLKRNYEAEAEEEEEPTTEEYRSLQRPKRKPRVSRNNSQKNQTAANNRSKKKKKTIQDDENNNEEKTIDGGGGNNQSTSSCSSEEHDSIINTSESKLGKAKANRGSATDPQSLYARKRRERINERLKILQNLVPNGTKVDISTMLEEAVQYVKFLQLQIKLLSSDDLWMYAPIAYNGMDISMYQKISPNFCL